LLLNLLHRPVDDGHTVIVIEHNLSVIAEADYIVDIGPEAGEAGGEIVATGTPEQVAKSRLSRTAPFLREVLATKNDGAVRPSWRNNGETSHGASRTVSRRTSTITATYV